MFRFAALLSAIALPTVALAQSHQPYAGMVQRPIKALSEQQVADLKAGRGMSLALPAELNGYPGPSHVLEHADALGLTAEQRDRTEALFEAMKAETVPVGMRLIEQEAQLDHLFATRQVTPANLTVSTGEIGATQAKLREAHLKYHLAMMAVLMPQQVAKYQSLRGYAVPNRQEHPHHHN